MFKKIVFALLLALPMSLFAQKFGVVDIEAVISAMPETKAMQTQLTDTSKKYEEEFETSGRSQQTLRRLPKHSERHCYSPVNQRASYAGNSGQSR